MTGLKVAAMAAGCALALAGCVTSGTVTDKSYDDPDVLCVGKPVVCAPRDECWQLHLRNEQGSTGEVCVPRENWDATAVGEHYDGPTVRR